MLLHREPRSDRPDEGADGEEEQHDVVGDGEQLLDDRPPAIELRLRAEVVAFHVHRLLI